MILTEHSYHLYVYIGVGKPVQVPVLTLSRWPVRAVPRIVGLVLAAARVGQQIADAAPDLTEERDPHLPLRARQGGYPVETTAVFLGVRLTVRVDQS